jgi:acyl-coenzyme A thioesterase PaaI-like protein
MIDVYVTVNHNGRMPPARPRTRTMTSERLVAEGFVVKAGRTLTITGAAVRAQTRGQRRLVAPMQQTLMVMHGRADA